MTPVHVVDRFLYAAWPDWDRGHRGALPPGEFRCSPEVAKMLDDHVKRYGWRLNGEIFGRPVLLDPDMPLAEVRFVARGQG